MAGTSWDRLGQMDAAFEIVAPVLRRVARAERLKLDEFHNEDPVWRLAFARPSGEACLDVTWSDSEPDLYLVSAQWWVDDYDSAQRRSHQELVGEFRRDQSPEDLEALLRRALEAVDGWGEGILDQVSGPFPEWRRQSREDFNRTTLPRRP